MKDILIFAAVMAGWIALNMWVLPYFGFQTCMSGGCRVPEVKPAAEDASPEPPVTYNLQPSSPDTRSRTAE